MSLSQIKYSIYEDKSNTMHYLSVPLEKELLYYATSAGRECLRADYFNTLTARNFVLRPGI